MAGPNFMRSPIFGTPQAQPGILNLAPRTAPSDMRKQRQLQAIGDTLSQLGIGLMSQQPSTTPQNPLMGLAQGLQGANQMMGQRQEQNMQQDRADMAQAQFGMQKQQFDYEQQKQAKQDAFEQAQNAQLEKLITGLTPEQQAAARGNKEAFFKAYSESLFPKAEGPQSSIAKLNADLKAGRIGQAEYDAAVRKETYIAPRDPDRTYRDITDKDGNVIGQVDDRGKKDFFSNGITIGADGSVQIGGPAGKAPSQATQQSDLRASMIDDAINEFDTINFDNIRTPAVIAAEAAAGNTVASAVAQKALNEDEKKLISNQSKIQEATISAITGAAYSEEQKQNMRAAYVPLATDELPTRIRKLKDAAKFLRQLNKNTGRKNDPVEASPAAAAPAPQVKKAPIVAPSLPSGEGWQ